MSKESWKVMKGTPLVAFIGYIGFVLVGGSLNNREGRPTAALVVIAIGSIVSATVSLGSLIRRARKSRELDRVLFTEATSIAFAVTMLAVLTYGLLEAFVDAPRLSMWSVWTVGMSSWAIASLVFRKKYS